LAMKMSRLAVAAPEPRPCRLFIFYVPHGVPVEHFDPAGTGDSLNLKASGIGLLSPLEPYKKNVSIVRGISMNDGASNHAAIRAMLTGFSDGNNADSIDYTIAKALGVTPYVLGTVPYGGGGFSSDSFLVKHGTWVRPTENPADAADEMLKGIGGNQTTPPPNTVDEAVFRKEALDLTEKEIDIMQKQLSGLTSEQNKLALHLSAIQALKPKISGTGPQPVVTCDTKPVLPSVDLVRNLDALDQKNFAKVLDAHLDVVAASFLCGTARVVTLQNLWVNADVNFGFEGGPGVAKGHHDPISHSWDAPGREEFAHVQSWFYERLASRLLSVLNQPDPSDPSSPDRTVLDNSLICVCSEVSDGANHNSDASGVWLDGANHFNYLPFVLIGGAGGYLKQQQVVTVDRKHTDMLATLAAAMGAPISQIGGQNVNVIEELKA
jgi:hypothetical protein